MKKNCLALLFLVMAISLCKGQYSDDNYKIQAGINGEVFVFSTFEGVLIFPNGDSIGDYYNTNTDFYLSKMDSLGNVIWVNHLDGGAAVWTGYGAPGIGLCTDKYGGVYIAANFRDSLKLSNDVTIKNSGQTSAFIAKYNVNGDLLWEKRPNGNLAETTGVDVSVDLSGNVYLTGKFSKNSSISFDTLTPIEHLGDTSANNRYYPDIYVVKFDSLGNGIWIKDLGGDLQIDVNSIVTSASGDSYIVGDVLGTGKMYFGSHKLDIIDDAYIAKIGKNGNEEWISKVTCYDKRYGCHFEQIAIDRFDNLYGTGQFEEMISFESNTVRLDHDVNDAFVVRYNENGDSNWAIKSSNTTSNPTTGYGRGMGVATDFNDDIFVIAQASPVVQFNPLQMLYASSYLVKLNSSGDGLCQVDLSQKYFRVEDLTIDERGNIYVIGFGINGYIIGKIGNNCNEVWSFDIISKVDTPPIGIVETTSSFVLTYFPNPTKGELTIQLDKDYTNVKVMITNVVGQIIQEEYFNTSSFLNFKIKGDKGYYIVSVFVEGNKKTTFSIFMR